MRFSRLILALLLPAAAALADDTTLTECFPPNTNMVFGISLRSLLDSPLVKSFEKDMQKMSADMLKDQPIPMLEWVRSGVLGFDPLKDIDDVIIAAAAAKEKFTGLLFLHGRFDASRFSGPASSYEGVPMRGGNNKGGGVIALLDASTAILGDEADVRAAIDRRGKPSRLSPALAAKVRSMAGNFEVWGLGDLPEAVQPPGAPADPMNGIDHFEFSAAMRHGLEITGQIHARTAQDAAQMQKSIEMIASMLKAQPASSGSKVDLQSAEGTVTLSIRISEEDLKKGIEAQRAGLLAAMNTPVKVTGGELAPTTPGPKTAPKQAQIVNNNRGETVKITLPGSK